MEEALGTSAGLTFISPFPWLYSCMQMDTVWVSLSLVTLHHFAVPVDL